MQLVRTPAGLAVGTPLVDSMVAGLRAEALVGALVDMAEPLEALEQMAAQQRILLCVRRMLEP